MLQTKHLSSTILLALLLLIANIFLTSSISLNNKKSTKATTANKKATETQDTENIVDIINGAREIQKGAQGAWTNLKSFNNLPHREWRGSRMAGKAQAAEMVLKLVQMLVGSLTKNAGASPTKWTLINSTSQPLRFIKSNSYQMDSWDGKWAQSVAPGQRHSFEAKCVQKLRHWGDTNAEAYYEIFCPLSGQNVRFELQVRNFEWNRVHLETAHAWNPCYDFRVWGGINKNEQESKYVWRDKWYDIPEAMVSGSHQIPNSYGEINVEVIPHEKATRFVMAYEHCNYLGRSMALGALDDGAFVISERSMGNPFMRNFNDIVSSVRVPPGLSVTFFENANFQGKRVTVTSDNNCLHGFHDAASSYIIQVVGEQS